jgi:Protein of unknown function (DUF3179)
MRSQGNQIHSNFGGVEETMRRRIITAVSILAFCGTLAAQQTPPRVFTPEGSFEGEPIMRSKPHDSVPSLNQPPFVPASKADFMQDNEPVMGVAAHGIAKAYPIWMMYVHEAVNDTIGLDPIVVAWCQACQTGIVYSRKVGTRVLTFGVEGVLWHDNEVLFDRQTRSLWSQGKDVAIEGKYRGTKLQYYDSSEMTWKDWLALHPDTLVMEKRTEMDRAGLTERQKTYLTNDRLPATGRTHPGGALPPKVFVVGFFVKGQAYAVAMDDLRSRGFLQANAGGVPVVVVATPDRLSAKVYLAGSHRFTKAEEQGARIVLADQKSGASWDGLAGRDINGKLKGQQLKQVQATTGFWFAWYAFNPNSKILRP